AAPAQEHAGADADGARPHRGPRARPGRRRRRLSGQAVRVFRIAGAHPCPAAPGPGPGTPGAGPGRPGTGPGAPQGAARRLAAGSHRQGVHAAGAAVAAPGAGAVAHGAGRTGLGHELRRRHQCHRSCRAAIARQAGRPVRYPLAAYRARHGLRAGAARFMIGPRLASIELRLTLLLGAIALAVSCVAGGMLFWALQREVQRQQITEVAGKLELIEHLIGMQAGPEPSGHLATTLDNILAGHGQLRAWIIGADGRPHYGGPPPRVLRAGPVYEVLLETGDC